MIDDLAARLLDAQVEFAKNQLRDTEYHALVIDEVDHALELASRLTLAQSVTPAMIKAVAAKYAVQVPVEGAIPELVGEIAARLYRHSANATTRVEDVIDSRSFDDLLSGAMDMELTKRIIKRLSESPAATDAVTSVLHSAATSAADDAARIITGNSVTRTVATAAARLLGPALPVLTQRADEATRRSVSAVLRRATADGDDAFTETIRVAWRRNRENPLSEYRSMVTSEDIEDFVVLVFEFWRTFRETAYFRALLDEGIDHVFDKYGDTSLYDLLDELGVGREDMIEEALRFGPPVIETLDAGGELDALLRRRIAPFYESELYRNAIAGSN